MIWWRHYSWRNFLWFSDIAFIGAVPALWLESGARERARRGRAAARVALERGLRGRLLTRRRITGLTDYMFEPERPRLLRGLSLFHVPLPLVLLWMVREYGYDARAGPRGAMVLAAVVLPWSRAVSTPDATSTGRTGWARGGRRSRRAYVALLYAAFVALVFMPTHVVLRALYGPQP